MESFREAAAWLPCPREQVFDLVADIERYPEFVPGYISARILSRVADRLEVEQAIGVGGFRERFVSEARLERPERISVHSREGLLDRLDIDWRFVDAGDGCRVTLRMTYRFASRLLQYALAPVFDRMAEQVLQAFIRRSHAAKG